MLLESRLCGKFTELSQNSVFRAVQWVILNPQDFALLLLRNLV
jgi:hypothetical protein